MPEVESETDSSIRADKNIKPVYKWNSTELERQKMDDIKRKSQAKMKAA